MGIFSVLEERATPGPADDFWYEPISRYQDDDVTPGTALGQVHWDHYHYYSTRKSQMAAKRGTGTILYTRC